MSNTIGLTATQEANSRAIVAVGHQLNLPDPYIICALMTACVESGIRIYANPAVPGSMQLPHEAVGYDHLSVGIFQQQVPMWGPVAVCQSAIGGANLFYQQLIRKYSTKLTLGQNCQAVQGSAFPDRYAAQQDRATQIFQAMSGLSDGLPTVTTGTSTASTGTPIPITSTTSGDALPTPADVWNTPNDAIDKNAPVLYVKDIFANARKAASNTYTVNWNSPLTTLDGNAPSLVLKDVFVHARKIDSVINQVTAMQKQLDDIQAALAKLATK